MSDTNQIEQTASAIAEGAPALRTALAAITIAPGVVLKPITSFAAQADLIPVLDLADMGRLCRLGAAAVGLAWQGPGRPKPRYEAGKPLDFGGAVLDELVTREVPLDVILQAGMILLMLAAGEFTKTVKVLERAKESAVFTALSPGL